MTRVCLGIGSNLGDRLEHLREAVAALASADGVRLVGVSSVYSTEPVGVSDQPEFLNAVVSLETGLAPEELLALARGVEDGRGRERGMRWGPRTLDIDILLYGDVEISSPELTVPHPRMTERRFVLVPLLEVEPDAALPDGTPLRDVLGSLEDEKRVRREGRLVVHE